MAFTINVRCNRMYACHWTFCVAFVEDENKCRLNWVSGLHVDQQLCMSSFSDSHWTWYWVKFLEYTVKCLIFVRTWDRYQLIFEILPTDDPKLVGRQSESSAVIAINLYPINAHARCKKLLSSPLVSHSLAVRHPNNTLWHPHEDDNILVT